MRARLLAVALGTATALLVAGCGTPAGVDGDLVNNWSAMPDAKVPVPAANACYSVSLSEFRSKLPPPVDCGSPHTVETVHVGAFTGEDATRDSPPPDGGPAQQKAYGECAKVAREFLGDDWRTGRLGLDMSLPNSSQWSAEARWYRCDLLEFKDLDSYDIVNRMGSLKNALAGNRPLGLGCFKVSLKNEEIDAKEAVDCGAGHNSEFAGVYEAPTGAFPAERNQREPFFANCRAVIARYVGVPVDNNLQYRVGVITGAFAKEDWDLGNRGVRCYLWMSDKNLTRSLKGAGPSALPIN